MKTTHFAFALCLLFLIISCKHQPLNLSNTINPLLGDISFVEKFGRLPDFNTDENLRIQTHLEYVESLLRSKSPAGLTPLQTENRENILDLLHTYWVSGVFPVNYDFPDKRVPCFIDKHQNICAVGYLIEQTAGREIAEDINAQYQYAYLSDMQHPAIDTWLQNSGLTREECAMIQPWYTPSYIKTYQSTKFSIFSTVLGASNASLHVINAIQIAQGTQSKAIPIIGLLAGAGQMVLGGSVFPDSTYRAMNYNHIPQKNASLLHMSMGGSTMILSAWNLIKNRQRKEKSLTWNLYPMSNRNRITGVGFSVLKYL